MSERSYPEGLEWVWLASDRVGHVGFFTTAGVGPVPVQAFSFDDLDIDLRLAEFFLIPQPGPVEGAALAAHGVFVYDWTDVERYLVPIHAYELVALPSKPINIETLTPELVVRARAVRFADVAFADAERLDDRAHMICRESEHRLAAEAERRFPYRVDIPVPGSGGWRQLTHMHEWCRENVAASAWDQHGHSERRKGEAPIDYARFYFMDEADAEAFRRRWL